MKKEIEEKIKKCPLFKNIESDNLKSLLDCLSAYMHIYEKDEFIFIREDKASYVGIIITGGAYIIQEDFWGNRTILTSVESGEMFGEAFSCANLESIPVSILSYEKSEIMLVDYKKIVNTCSSACVFHTQLIKNMLHIIAEKNILLTKKIEHISKRTTREKLLSLLSEKAVKNKSNIVKLSFNRRELADYLCVDRSALSRELSLMQKEGLIRYNKNYFEILQNSVI